MSFETRFNLPHVTRIMYKRKNKNSTKEKEYGLSGVFLGYPENNKHFRERIKNMIIKE